jgi:methyl-accepting chemotaxis protein
MTRSKGAVKPMPAKKKKVAAKGSKAAPKQRSNAAERQRRFQAVDENMAMIEFDLEGTILDANARFLRVMGYERAEVVGKKHRLFVEESYAASDAYRQFWAALRAGETQTAEYRRLGKGAAVVWLQASYVPVRDSSGATVGVVKLAQDRTTEKTRELEEARENARVALEAARVKSAVDASNVPMMMADKDFTITYINQSMLAMLTRSEPMIRSRVPNFSVQGLIGTNIDTFHRAPQATRHKIAGAARPFKVSLELGGLTIEQVVVPARAPDGSVLGYSVEWHDQTEQLAAQSEVEAVLKAAVAGDLSKRLEVSRFTGFIRQVSEGMNRLLDSMSGSLGQVKVAVDQIGEASSQLRATSQMMSAGSLQLNRAAEDSSVSLNRAADMVRSNAENASMANQLVTQTSAAAQDGQARMEDMSAAMGEINASAQQIAKIIKVIDEIAFQTNLLALNAAVEAARAGRHGKGFAVVAQEVRNLAERSAKAAKETAQLIEDSVNKVELGVRIAADTRGALDDIIANVGKVVDLAGEIATASGEQSRTLGAVSESMTQVTENAQAGSQQSSEVASAAEEMGRQMEVLRQRLSSYTLAAVAAQPGLPGGISPELMEQIAAFLGARGLTPQARAWERPTSNDNAAPAHPPVKATGTADPRAVLPLDHDERGFRGF